MITFKQFLNEAVVKYKQNEFSSVGDVRKRFEELRAPELYKPFVKWFISGVFSASPSEMEEFDEAMNGIRRLLTPEILRTYSKVGPVYQAFNLPIGVSKTDVKANGLEIKNQISAWTPDVSRAREYKAYMKDGSVVLRHVPKASEVLVFLNQETIDFFHMARELVANPGEVVLSLPTYRIEPDDIKESQA